jgi:hypothetical protein
MSLGAGDFPRYVTKIVIDNHVMDEAGKSISVGAWTVSFVGRDPAVATWDPGPYSKWGIMIGHLKCHNDVYGDKFDNPSTRHFCNIFISDTQKSISITIDDNLDILHFPIDYPALTFQ